MSTKIEIPGLNTDISAFRHTAKILHYPCGICDLIASTSADFGTGGWERSGWRREPPSLADSQDETSERQRQCVDPEGEDRERSVRRARAKLRRLALANEFRWFVTLTIDPGQVDSKDGKAVIKKLNTWTSNAVQRKGLRYLLVPERHKKGGIHFHGFFSDTLEMVDSGTIKPPFGGKPRRPRSDAQRRQWLAEGGKIVYNIPGWSLGFTTAIELYGEYPAAVAYVCKYIGKEEEKPAGRWYYSGGDLREPTVQYCDISPRDLIAAYKDRAFYLDLPGRGLAIANGIKEEDL